MPSIFPRVPTYLILKDIQPPWADLATLPFDLTFDLGGQIQGLFGIIQLPARASPRSFDWGVGFIGTQTHLPPKFSFSSDFDYFILKMLENGKLYTFQEQRFRNIHNFWGSSPAVFKSAGVLRLTPATPPPPPSTKPLTPASFPDVIRYRVFDLELDLQG